MADKLWQTQASYRQVTEKSQLSNRRLHISHREIQSCLGPVMTSLRTFKKNHSWAEEWFPDFTSPPIRFQVQ